MSEIWDSFLSIVDIQLRELNSILPNFSWRSRKKAHSKHLPVVYFAAAFLLLCFADDTSGRSTNLNFNQPIFQYNNYLELTNELNMLHRRYANVTRLYSLGKSERGRELWVLAITSDPNNRPLGKPAVKFVGNMHGNEPVGRALLVHFAHHVLQRYSQSDTEIVKILNTTEIHLLPAMNPDGFETAEEGTCSGTKGRYNSRGADLNRNFPDFMRKNLVRREKETKSVIKWLKSQKFVLSANFHGGAVVASYPWDNYAGFSQVPKLTPTEDHDVYYHLATTYAQSHQHMHTGLSCGDYFEGGVTNGAAWFPLTGGMQDFNYVVAGVMEITLEVSCCKFPPRSMLSHFWAENKDAMVEFVRAAHIGVKGLVVDEMDDPIPHSFVTVQGRSMEYETSERGEFWRLLLPGNYTLRVTASGYYDEVQRVSFGDRDMPVWVEFRMKRNNERGEFLQGEFMPPQQVANDFPVEILPAVTASSETTISRRTTTSPIPSTTVRAKALTNASTTVPVTNAEYGNGTPSSLEPSSTTPVSNVSSTNYTDSSIFILDTEPPNSIIPVPTLNPSAVHIGHDQTGDASLRRYLADGLSDQAKVISPMRTHRRSSFFARVSAALSPRTKYQRRVLEAYFPFSPANLKEQPH